MGTVSHSPRVPILENLVFGNKHFALSWFLLHRSQTYTTKYCRICLLLGKDDIISLFSDYFLSMYKIYTFKDGGRGALGDYFEMVKLLNIVDGWRENDIFKYLDF